MVMSKNSETKMLHEYHKRQVNKKTWFVLIFNTFATLSLPKIVLISGLMTMAGLGPKITQNRQKSYW